LTVTPVVAVVLVGVLFAVAAGAAVALGGKKSTRKEAAGTTPTTTRVASSSTRPLPPSAAAGAADSVYVRYADAAKVVHYMYCTTAKGCGLLEVAKDGSSKITATPIAGVWHLEQRFVIEHDPCINTVQNAQRIGTPGDLVRVVTTDLQRDGTQTIKGITVPARITGGIAERIEHPVVPGCTFTGYIDFTQPVDSPVTEFVPAGRSTAKGSA
jgi:hypothetical protein